MLDVRVVIPYYVSTPCKRCCHEGGITGSFRYFCSFRLLADYCTSFFTSLIERFNQRVRLAYNTMGCTDPFRMTGRNKFCMDYFCRIHYKVKFDLDPGYIFQTALPISLS